LKIPDSINNSKLKLYKRLLKFERNLSKKERITRKDLGF